MTEDSRTSLLRLQPVRIVLGYLAACLASGYASGLLLGLPDLVYALSHGEWSVAADYAKGLVPEYLGRVGTSSSRQIAVLALAPAAVVIAVAEARRLRSATFYGFVGALSANLVVAYLAESFTVLVRPAGLLVTAAGLIFGLVYWAIAGRTAGDWLARPQGRGRGQDTEKV